MYTKKMAALSVEHVCKSEGKNSQFISKLIRTGKGIHQLDNLSKLVMLEKVDLARNSIDDAKGLADCKQIKWLNMAHNQLSSLNFVKKLRLLTVLNLGNNSIKDMTAVAELTSLKALVLNNNEITNVTGIEKLQGLNALILSHNQISEIDISGLTSLNRLQLSHNNIHQFPDIKFNYHLKTLSLNNNHIKLIPAGCIGENWLTMVDLAKNEINKTKQISALTSIKSIKQLNLKGNQLTESEGYVDKTLEMFPRLTTLDSQPIEKIRRTGYKRQQPEKTTSPKAEKQKFVCDESDDDAPKKKKTLINKEEQPVSTLQSSPHKQEKDKSTDSPNEEKVLKKKKHKKVKGTSVDTATLASKKDEKIRKKRKEKTQKAVDSVSKDSQSEDNLGSNSPQKEKQSDSDNKVLRTGGTYAPKDAQSGVLGIKEHKRKVEEGKEGDIFSSFQVDVGSGIGAGW